MEDFGVNLTGVKGEREGERERDSPTPFIKCLLGASVDMPNSSI